ncbi:hypothetical protein JRO89_XS09G0128800 [Xanthoceras sorbifolium]|uniref:Retrovirus-related Pol polyprotein from transposon TNT 1-94-like beta-barrel domain-containing protein n=1 Tax=Xanthoceras sorbifolium TaxID=99658 RepID=A0ABQ8HL32_9ROSI|nr:hypothetical protein JRO89_XS09G0128800 [Xanthoceras sorbifolium]
MKKKYQGSSRVKCALLQALRKDFNTIYMKDGESVTGYCARTMGIANKMRFHGEQMNDVVIIEKILCSLAPKYDYVVGSIEESKDIDALSLDELQSSLLVHEQKMNRSTITDEQALKAFTFIVSKLQRCHKLGHYRSNCYVKLPKDKEKWEKSNFAEKKEVETLLMAYHVKNEPPESDVCFGDCSTVSVMGKGDIQIKTRNGYVETISDIFYIPDLKSNLLSAGQLQEKGYIITIQKGACKIYDPSKEQLLLFR